MLSPSEEDSSGGPHARRVAEVQFGPVQRAFLMNREPNFGSVRLRWLNPVPEPLEPVRLVQFGFGSPSELVHSPII